MPEQEIQAKEMQFPEISGAAFAAARREALASNLSVLQSENGIIFEVFPDGRRVEKKRIDPPSQYVPGQVFIIR